MTASCQEILPFIKPGWVGVEIGVCRGHSALAILEHGVRFLYLVDPWSYYDGIESGTDVDVATLKCNAEEDHKNCLFRLAAYQNRFAIFRMPSAEAERYIPNNLDFVWVDGNHRYEWVKSDLEYYWPKIKPDGVLCGHDYTNSGSCGVARAVDEFAADRTRVVEAVLPSWVIRKVVR